MSNYQYIPTQKQHTINIGQYRLLPGIMAQANFPTRAATIYDLNDFQNNQHVFSRLQLLPSFNGGPITRFDSWLESFESIVDGSGWSEEKTIQMMRAKLTDKAFSVMPAVLKEHPHDYFSIKERLLDHFHGDESIDLYLKKFNKAKRKPGENVIDYTHRLQDVFTRAAFLIWFNAVNVSEIQC